MKKFASLLLIFMLIFAPLQRADAFIPLAAPAVAEFVALGAAAAVVAGYNLYVNPNSFSFSDAGNMLVSAALQATDSVMLKARYLVAANDLYNEIAANQLIYPDAAKLLKNYEKPYTFEDPKPIVGISTFICPDDVQRTVSSVGNPVRVGATLPTPSFILTNSTYTLYVDDTINGIPAYLKYIYYLTASSTYNPPSLEKFIAQTPAITSTSGTSAAQDLSRAADVIIDDTLPATSPTIPDNILDASSDTPFSPPQLDNVKDLAVAVTAAQAAVDTQESETDRLRAIATNAQAVADADPTELNIQIAAAALTAANQADIDLAAAQTSLSAQMAAMTAQTSAPVQIEAPPDNPTSIDATPAKKTLDWSKYQALKSVLLTKFPFNMLTQLTSYYNLISYGNGNAPSFSLPIMGNYMTVNLAVFDPVAIIIRYLLGLIMTVGVIFFIVRFWRN